MNDLDMDSSNSSLLFYQAKGHPLIHDFMRYLRSVLDNMLLIKNTNNVKPMLEWCYYTKLNSCWMFV